MKSDDLPTLNIMIPIMAKSRSRVAGPPFARAPPEPTKKPAPIEPPKCVNVSLLGAFFKTQTGTSSYRSRSCADGESSWASQE